MLLYLFAIFLLSLSLLFTILFALQYFGMFDSIHVSTGPTPYQYGSRSIVYRVDYGHYNDSSPLFTQICSILPKLTTFGLYIHKDSFDDSIRSKLSPDRLAYTNYVFMIGAILPDKTESTLLEPSTRALLKQKGYRYAQLPSETDNVVYCKFPFRGIMSVVIASRRVNSAIEKYIEERRLCAYPKMEIYNKDHIYYILPLSQQNEFIELISKSLDGFDDVAGAAINGMEFEEIYEDKDGVGDEDSGTEPQSGHSDSVESNSSYELVD